jgi:hypothetical protein
MIRSIMKIPRTNSPHQSKLLVSLTFLRDSKKRTIQETPKKPSAPKIWGLFDKIPNQTSVNTPLQLDSIPLTQNFAPAASSNNSTVLFHHFLQFEEKEKETSKKLHGIMPQERVQQLKTILSMEKTKRRKYEEEIKQEEMYMEFNPRLSCWVFKPKLRQLALHLIQKKATEELEQMNNTLSIDPPVLSPPLEEDL